MEDTYKTLRLQGDIADEERNDAIALENAKGANINAAASLLRAENAAGELGLKLADAQALLDFSAADNLFTLSQADLETRTRLKPIADAAH